MIQIRHRYTNAVLLSIAHLRDADLRGTDLSRACLAGADLSGTYLRGADLSRTDLRGTNLSGAELRGADLSRTDLRGTDLSGACLAAADLSGADLRSASLSRADLRDADLRAADLRAACFSGADLSRADLRRANISGASLRMAKFDGTISDYYDVLANARDEVPELLKAIREGRMEGSVYEGECACLVGTIANIRRVDYERLEGIAPLWDRPAELFFSNIAKGDTPANSAFSALVEMWTEEWLLSNPVTTRSQPTNARELFDEELAK